MQTTPEQPPESPGEPRREFSDADWDELIATIEQGKVIPLVGQGAVTFGADDVPLMPALANLLARRLGPPAGAMGCVSSVNDVARTHLAGKGVRNRIYTQLHQALQDLQAKAVPGPTLNRLADIEGFSLYLSTTCDTLLEAAITQARATPCRSGGFFPASREKDLSTFAEQLESPTVYHLLGKSSMAAAEFVAWEEDLLDFLSELPRYLGTDAMRHLSSDLQNHALLAVGLQFSDWVLRLLLRITRQGALSQVMQYSWLAEGAAQRPHPATVMFFGSVSRNIQIIECSTPSAFVAELHTRWRTRFPKNDNALPAPRQGRGLVFVSYAREDEVAARRFGEGLRTYGCSVYFDRDRLKPGMSVHHELKDQVSERCAIFVSLISPFTESDSGPSYFRRERNWAAERLADTAEKDRPKFYLPVLIHTRLPTKLEREPSQIKDFQWVHCPDGGVSPEVGKKIRELQEELGAKE